MNFLKAIPILNELLDLIYAHRENKALKKDLEKAKRRIKKLEKM